MKGFLCDVEEYLIKKRFKMCVLRRNVVRKGIGRLEIVAVDADKVLVVEVKNKLENWYSYHNATIMLR